MNNRSEDASADSLPAFFDRCEHAAPEQRQALETEATKRLLATPDDRKQNQSVLLTALGLLHRLQPDLPASEKSLVEAERLADGAGDLAWLARVRLYLTGHFSLRGDFDRALELAALSRVDLAPELLPRLLSNVAGIHQIRQDGPAALAAFTDALTAAEQAQDGNVIVTILNNRGSWHNDTGAFVKAEVDFRRALLLDGMEIEPFRLASVQHNLGLALTRQGMVRSGLSEMDQARVLLENHGDNAIQTRLDRTEALFRARLLAEAREDAQLVLSEIDSAGVLVSLPDALLLSARVAVAQRDLARAEELAADAADAFDQQQRGQPTQTDAAGSLGAVLDLATPLPADLDTSSSAVREALLLRAEESSDAETSIEALRLVQQGPAPSPADRVLSEFASVRLSRQAGENEAAAIAVDRCFAAIADTASDFSSLEIRQAILSSLVPLQVEATSLAVEMGRPELFARWLTTGAEASRHRRPPAEESKELIERLEELRSLGFNDHQPSSSTVAEQTQRLTERIQMISRFAEPRQGAPTTAPAQTEQLGLFVGTDGTELFGAVDDGSSIARLGTVTEFDDLLGRLEFAISLVARAQPEPTQRQLDAVIGVAAQLDELLLAPFRQLLPTRSIRVTATGLVAGFPWRLLPSLVFNAVSVEQGGSTAALPALPSVAAIVGPGVDAREELEQVARHYPDVTIIDGAEATVAEARQAFAAFDVVHVAAHGQLDGNDPLLSSLELIDGQFTLYDIEMLPRLPHTVVLASCRLAGESVRDTGYGLGSVLISGGVSQVVATAQPLADRYAGAVMGELYGRLADHGRADQALAELSTGQLLADPFADTAARSLIVIH